MTKTCINKQAQRNKPKSITTTCTSSPFCRVKTFKAARPVTTAFSLVELDACVDKFVENQAKSGAGVIKVKKVVLHDALSQKTTVSHYEE